MVILTDGLLCQICLPKKHVADWRHTIQYLLSPTWTWTSTISLHQVIAIVLVFIRPPLCFFSDDTIMSPAGRQGGRQAGRQADRHIVVIFNMIGNADM